MDQLRAVVPANSIAHGKEPDEKRDQQGAHDSTAGGSGDVSALNRQPKSA
jgi:hypothetical protein